GVNWFKMPDGALVVSLKDRQTLTIPRPDALGRVDAPAGRVPMQEALDQAYQMLLDRYGDSWYLWDLDTVRTWGQAAATQKQLEQDCQVLVDRYGDSRYLWDLETVRRWGKAPATQKQLEIIQKRCRGFDVTGLTKGEASQIMNRLFNGPKKGRRSA